MRTASLKRRQLLSITPKICLGASRLPATVKQVSSPQDYPQAQTDVNVPKVHRVHLSVAEAPSAQLQPAKASCQHPNSASDAIELVSQHNSTAAAAQQNRGADLWSYARTHTPMSAWPLPTTQSQHDMVKAEGGLQMQNCPAAWTDYTNLFFLKQPRLQPTDSRLLSRSLVVRQSQLSMPFKDWPGAQNHSVLARSTLAGIKPPYFAKSLPLVASSPAYSTARDANADNAAAARQQSSDRQSASDGMAESAISDGAKIVLYKGSYMRLFRLLVRFKIFQLVGIAALAIPINTFLVEGSVSGVQLVMAVSLVLGCGMASTTLWWFSQRYIGELSLIWPDKLCISVLDFWGNRQDSVISIDRLIPPLQHLSKTELQEIAKEPVIPFNIAEDRQYLISLRHGGLVDKNKLIELLKGGMPSQ